MARSTTVLIRNGTIRGYKGRSNQDPATGVIAIYDDPAPDSFLGESTDLRLVRLRLCVALVTMFAIPIAIAAPMIYGRVGGTGALLLLPTVIGIALAAVLGLLGVWLAHRVLEPTERLEGALRTLGGAYDQARSEALLDGLTGLGNHRSFQEEIERQWSGAVRYGRPLSLVLLDLDEFKEINDFAGHAAGDQLLRHFGSQITAGLRRSDRAFRIGGDEFAIILPETNGDGAYAMVRRLLATCLEGEARRGGSNALSFSAGVGALPGSARDRGSLYSQADAALYWGKRHGRTCVTLYDRERHESATTGHKPVELSSLVARVAADGAVRAVFQPIYDLVTGAPCGYEGLVRPLPDSGFNDPGTMFAAAEATGRTAELDIACLEAVMGAASRLRLPGSLTINLSPRTLEREEFSIQGLLRIIVRHGLDPRRIVLELTEREAVEDIDRLRRAAEDCRLAGIRLAADDVGSGNAGLRLLSQLRFDIVKIDLSLVQGGTRRERSLEVVRALRDLADRWGALVVAEGIETPAQLEVVRSLEIGAGQGYLLGRPVEQPPTESIDLDGLMRGTDWLMNVLRAVPA